MQKLFFSSKYRLPNFRRGFTLFETIIYISLFSLIASFVIALFYQTISGYNRQRDRIEVDSEANFMMQKILWAVTGAQTISQPAAGATSSVLSISKYNYAQNPIVFDIGSRNLRISEGGGAAAFLGSSRIFVDKFIVNHLAAVQSAPEAVKVILAVVSSDITRPSASTTLTDTIYLNE